MGSSSNLMTGGISIFSELVDNKEMLENQYEILQGKLPEKYNEIMIILPEKNAVSDMLLYAIGLRDLDELEEELNTLDLAEWHQTSNEKIEPTQQELKLTILIFFHLKLFNRMFVSHADSGELSSSKKGIFSLRLVFWLWLHLIVSSE